MIMHSKLSQLLKIAMLTHPEHNTLITTTSLECHPPYTQAVVPSLYIHNRVYLDVACHAANQAIIQTSG